MGALFVLLIPLALIVALLARWGVKRIRQRMAAKQLIDRQPTLVHQCPHCGNRFDHLGPHEVHLEF